MHPYTQEFGKWLSYFGHEVKNFESMRFETDSKYSDPIIPKIYQMNKEFIRVCQEFKPDLVLVFKGIYLLRESLELVKKTVRPIMATWWVDDPFTIWKCDYTTQPFEHVAKSLHVWDHFFIMDSYFIPRLKRIGVKNPYWLPMATDMQYFAVLKKRNAEDEAFYGGDISFVGTPTRLRAAMVRELRDFGIKLWGIPWRDPVFQKLQVKTNLKLAEIKKIYNYTKINVNNHCLVNVNGANVRVFDIPACEGFLLTDRMEDIVTRLFVEGKEVVTYTDFQDMRNKVKYYLKNEKERCEIAANARQKVLKKHLYKHRVEEILSVLRMG